MKQQQDLIDEKNRISNELNRIEEIQYNFKKLEKQKDEQLRKEREEIQRKIEESELNKK